MSDRPTVRQLTAFDVQNTVENIAWQNRKIFALRRRQPWISSLAYACAIDAYLLGLEHGEHGRVHHPKVERHLKEIKAQLAEDHLAKKRAERAKKTA